jgi:hypothetical protein
MDLTVRNQMQNGMAIVVQCMIMVSESMTQGSQGF